MVSNKGAGKYLAYMQIPQRISRAEWHLESIVKGSSRSNEDTQFSISLEKKSYQGWLTVSRPRPTSLLVRLWFSEELSLELKRTFLMSYMRSLEETLSGDRGGDIEKIPFWEFLDIEFDTSRRHFKFVAYYRQLPSFPHLFHRLIESPSLKIVYDEIERKTQTRIQKQDWRERSRASTELGALNVIYTLIDSKNRLLYVGQAKNLTRRLLRKTHTSIPDWDFYRYDKLPDSLIEHRIPLERMMIRVMASFLPNSLHPNRFPISEYRLTNRVIDK